MLWPAVDLRKWGGPILWVVWACTGTVQADRSAHVRVFRASHGLKESSVTAVSSSPRGNIWIRHGDADEISVLDGYSVRRMPSPGKEPKEHFFRIYESQAGQLWSIYSEGLVLYDGSRWVRHPVAEIRNEMENPGRLVRQIPLLPLQQDRALFLLSDRLVEYDASTRQTTVLKEAANSSLGKFSEMTEAREAPGRERGIWIAAAKGMGKVAKPPRQSGRGVAWLELHAIGDSLGVENLQRPFENDRGEVIVAATQAGTNNKRVILHYDGKAWSRHEIPNDNIRQAWPGWDGSVWAFTMNWLLRFDPAANRELQRERMRVGLFKDAASEANGVFWLASAEGLMRYGPLAWRSPPESLGLDGMVNAILEDSSRRLWFSSTDGLTAVDGNQWQRFAWPEGFEPEFQTTDSLYQLANGTLAVATRDKPLLFNPTTGRYETLRHPDDRRLRLVGPVRQQAVWVQSWDPTAGSRARPRLEQFDGATFATIIESSPAYDLSADLLAVREAQNGDVWLGGESGVAVWRHGQWQTFRPEDGAPDRPMSWLETAEGKIWFGTEDRIFEFNGVKWSVIHSRLDRISGMIKARNGRIWVTTGTGLLCFSDGSWVSTGLDEGLPSESVSAVFEDRQGRLWAGTARGISCYHPETDSQPPKTLPPTLLTPGNPRADRKISLNFEGVDKWNYTSADRLLFRYRLDEGPWSSYTNAAAHTFEPMRPGKHRFEVQAMDRNWNEDPAFAFIEFSAVIPWYKEARLIVVLICGATLVLFFAALAVNRHLQLTRQLARSYAEVEQMVAVRTKELERANQELIQSQKMRALGTIAAGIAHDFNNILSIIKGSAQIIEGHLDDKEKILTRVTRIKTVVDQGAGVVKSMLGLSRARDHDLAPTDLNGVVDETLKLLGDQFLHEVIVRFVAAPELPRVLALKELLQQMLLNLILNAADAMSGIGEITIRTGATRDLPPDLALSPVHAQAYVFVAVSDSGCGIAPDLLPRIFEPFFTTKALSSRRGTGLGLSMVYELAKEMGYGLKVESVVGKGSDFFIFLPVRTRPSER